MALTLEQLGSHLLDEVLMCLKNPKPLIGASDQLLEAAAQTISSWQPGGPFHNFYTDALDSVDWEVLLARDRFIEQAMAIDPSSQWDLSVTLRRGKSVDLLTKFCDSLRFVSSLCVDRRYFLLDTALIVITKRWRWLRSVAISCPTTTSAIGYSSLRGLPYLTTLVLSEASIAASAFAVIAQLEALTELCLVHCSGVTDATLMCLQSMVRLRSLKICDNRVISGSGLESIQAMKSLTEFVCTAVPNLTDDGMRHISLARSLTSLDVTHAPKLTDEGLLRLSSIVAPLEMLVITSNATFTVDAYAAISRIQTLEHLEILSSDHPAPLGDDSFAHLAALRRLRVLRVEWVKNLTDIGVRHLEVLSGTLEELHLPQAFGITGAALDSIAKLRNLRSLGLRGCSVEALANIGALSAVATLTSLDLTGAGLVGGGITDTHIVKIGTIASLRSLNLSTAPKIGDTGLAALATLRKLTSLNLSCITGAPLCDVGIARVVELPRLRYLDLQHSSVSAEALSLVQHLVE